MNLNEILLNILATTSAVTAAVAMWNGNAEVSALLIIITLLARVLIQLEKS